MGSDSFRAALDAEFQVKREGEQTAFILTRTKMKDAEEPKRRAYDLQPVKLFTDEEGKEIHSLALRDVAREVEESDPDLIAVPNLSDNHQAIWQSVRSRNARGEACTKVIIIDDLKAIRIDIHKHFSRWLGKLTKAGLVSLEGENIVIQAQRNVGE
ncbi:hypothetical protein CRM79_01015 [Pantoea agglomerans]|nr:hypothetical protein CRM79_01015 [Pantoea agglomerans]